MKICVLGNSHAASLKNGWDDISCNFPNIQITFFASRANGLQGLIIDDNRLVPNTKELSKNIAFTSGGSDHVDLGAYDIFLIYALGLLLPTIDRRCSRSVAEQSCMDRFSRNLNSTLCKRIRTASKKPIFLGHTPQMAKPLPSPPRANQLNYYEVLRLMNRCLSIEDATIVAQPEETLVNDWYTVHEFAIGSTRLDIGDNLSGQVHPDSDVWHMNNIYGRLWLENFFHLLPFGSGK
jgi:hypothetical protein